MSDSHVSEVNRERALKFLADVARTMQLLPYEIVLLKDPSEDGSHASIMVQPGYLVAELALCAGWDDLKSDDQLFTLIHESGHMMLAGLSAAHARLVEESGFIPAVMHEYAWAAFRDAMETVCENLASVLQESYGVQEGWEDALKYAKKVVRERARKSAGS